MNKRSVIIFLLAGIPFFLKAQTSGRDNAGLQGNSGAVSGFFETNNPVNYPAGAGSWWHLLDIRHTNPENNYAMQFSGSFFDQNLWFRKTNDNPSEPWSKVLLERGGKVGVGLNLPEYALDIFAESYKNLRLGGDNPLIKFRPSGYNNGDGAEIWQTQNGSIAFNINGSTRALTILSNNNIGIGTTSPQERLSVNGKIRAQEVKVETTNWPDYVFADNYNPISLEELEKFIKVNKHLPEMPAAKEIEANGVDLGNMNKLLLKKVEELTLHLIEKNKQLDRQQQKMAAIENDYKELKTLVNKLINKK